MLQNLINVYTIIVGPAGYGIAVMQYLILCAMAGRMLE